MARSNAGVSIDRESNKSNVSTPGKQSLERVNRPTACAGMAGTRSSRVLDAKADAVQAQRVVASDASSSSDDPEPVVDSRRSRGKRQQPASRILSQFTSLEALLNDDLAEKRKRQHRGEQLQQLREASEAAEHDATIGKSSAMQHLMTNMASTMSTLSDDNYLFTASVSVTAEKFGYVFAPMQEVCT